MVAPLARLPRVEAGRVVHRVREAAEAMAARADDGHDARRDGRQLRRRPPELLQGNAPVDQRKRVLVQERQLSRHGVDGEGHERRQLEDVHLEAKIQRVAIHFGLVQLEALTFGACAGAGAGAAGALPGGPGSGVGLRCLFLLFCLRCRRRRVVRERDGEPWHFGEERVEQALDGSRADENEFEPAPVVVNTTVIAALTAIAAVTAAFCLVQVVRF